ncbi:hypothetical protein ACFLQI_01715 [Candidatus Undinarchaeota archaeon]
MGFFSKKKGPDKELDSLLNHLVKMLYYEGKSAKEIESETRDLDQIISEFNEVEHTKKELLNDLELIYKLAVALSKDCKRQAKEMDMYEKRWPKDKKLPNIQLDEKGRPTAIPESKKEQSIFTVGQRKSDTYEARSRQLNRFKHIVKDIRTQLKKDELSVAQTKEYVFKYLIALQNVIRIVVLDYDFAFMGNDGHKVQLEEKHKEMYELGTGHEAEDNLASA